LSIDPVSPRLAAVPSWGIRETLAGTVMGAPPGAPDRTDQKEAVLPAATEHRASMKDLLVNGVHFGHQTRRWNPKMKPYIFAERGGIYIIDLQKTTVLLDDACAFLKNTAGKGGSVLFVGTKKQCQESIKEQAERIGMPFVNTRWLGGLLTNFSTLNKRIKRLHELRQLATDGSLDLLPTREALNLRADLRKLEQNLGGVADMDRLPAAVFVVDPRKEQIVVREARKLKIPIVGLVDTNCDPDEIDYVIPGNDDAIRALRLFASRIADACVIGSRLFKERGVSRAKVEEEPKEQVIHVSSGGDGPKVEIAQGGSQLEPEASATPED
jgi:small subunit ribosomal protein S2